MCEGKRKQAELGNGNRKRWAANFSQWISWPVPQRPQTGLALHICPGLVAFPYVSPYVVEREHDPRWGSFLYPQDYGRELEGGGLLAASLLLGEKILQSKKDLGWWEVITESMRQQNPFYLVNLQNTSSQFCSLHPSCKEKARRYLSRKN